MTTPRQLAPAACSDLMGPPETLSVRGQKRAENGMLGSLVSRRCECARPDCNETFPEAADRRRLFAERFIVVPRHRAGDHVAAATDQYFVVDPIRPALPRARSTRSGRAVRGATR
jgi:hypothetical protein